MAKMAEMAKIVEIHENTSKRIVGCFIHPLAPKPERRIFTIMRFLFSILFLSIVSAKRVFSTMRDCSVGYHIGHIREMSLDPVAPVAGQWVHITVDYDLDSPVTGGEATYSASFNGFPLTPSVDSLCADFANTTSSCPLAAGPVFYQNWIQMGDGTIHGTLDASTSWSDQDGTRILCWGFTVRI